MSATLELASSDQAKPNRRCFFGQRHLITLIGFLSCFLISSNRLVLGVSLVSMVKHGQKNEIFKKNGSEMSCPLPSAPSSSVIGSNIHGEFDWSSELQGYILGVGFFSNFITHAPAGRLVDAVGAKFLLVISNALAGVFVILSPLAARWNVYALLVLQFLRGASQGITVPAMYKMMSNWIPRTERGTLNTISVCGYTVGVAVSGVVTGWLCDIPYLGWPSAFYFWGTFCIMISILTHFVYYEHPSDNPWITDQELNFITEGIEKKISDERLPTPWKKIFTSIPTYAYFYGLFGHVWGVSYFLTVHPTFMGTILHYSTVQSGITSCLPVLLSTCGGLSASAISHWVSKKYLISLNKLRTTVTSISAFGFSLCMLGILLAGCDAVINILCFALSLFCLGIALAGVMISGVDMSPTFAGSLIGVAHTLSGMGSFVNPLITGFLTTHETLPEWQRVFWMNLGVVGSSGLVYFLFGSAEVQSWNYPEGEHPTEDKKEERRFSHKSPDKITEINEHLEIYNSRL